MSDDRCTNSRADNVAGLFCAFSFALSGLAIARQPGLLAPVGDPPRARRRPDDRRTPHARRCRSDRGHTRLLRGHDRLDHNRQRAVLSPCLATLNAGYVGTLLEQYLENPEAVDPGVASTVRKRGQRRPLGAARALQADRDALQDGQRWHAEPVTASGHASSPVPEAPRDGDPAGSRRRCPRTGSLLGRGRSCDGAREGDPYARASRSARSTRSARSRRAIRRLEPETSTLR